MSIKNDNTNSLSSTQKVSNPFQATHIIVEQQDKTILPEIAQDIIIAMKENRIKDLDFNFIFSELRQKLYTNNEDLPSSLSIIQEITFGLLKIPQSTKLDFKTQKDLLKCLENLMIILILHFDLTIIDNGFTILKYMISITESEYHKDCLNNFIALIQIFKSKRSSLNVSAYENIIANLSSAILVLIHLTDIDTRKTFFQFVSNNFDDYALVYSMCYCCSSEIRLYRLYSTESVIGLTDKYFKELDRHCKIIESLVKNYDKTTSTRNKIRNIFETVGQICKVMDSFYNHNNRTYNYDKLIKNITISLKSMLSVITSSELSVTIYSNLRILNLVSSRYPILYSMLIASGLSLPIL
jgi:hypothetical protein